jgi:hypothetical protein
MAAFIWAGIYLTGFSVVNWLVYLPAAGVTMAALIGFCPSQLVINKLFNTISEKVSAWYKARIINRPNSLVKAGSTKGAGFLFWMRGDVYTTAAYKSEVMRRPRFFDTFFVGRILSVQLL